MQKILHVTMRFDPSLRISRKTDGQSFFLLPKDERSASVKWATRNSFARKLLAVSRGRPGYILCSGCELHCQPTAVATRG